MGSDSIENWYAPLGSDLSFGDIVQNVPSGLIDSPLTICQPHNAEPKGKSLYAPIDQVPKRRAVEFIHAKGFVGLGIVVWPDCQIDKLKNQNRPEKDWFAAIAPVQPMSRLPVEVHEHIQSFNRAQFFPLPAAPPDIAEPSYVDLRYIWPVRYALLSNRVITLTDEARSAFNLHRFWFDTELRLAPLPCPHCGETIDVHDMLRPDGA